MKYANGRSVALGDRVRLWEGQYGTVVCSIDTAEYTTKYPKKEWAYLTSGILIETTTGELFHYAEPDEDFELVTSDTSP